MLVIGAGGLALQLIDDLESNYKELIFWDGFRKDDALFLDRHAMISTDEEVIDYFEKISKDFVVCVGGPDNRRALVNKFESLGGRSVSLISDHAVISKYAHIAEGVIVCRNAVIEAAVTIGAGSLINTGCIITHECTINEFVEIAPGSVLGGKVVVGDLTFIGLNATILPKIEVGHNCMVGAGSVVTRDIPDFTKVKGVPAKTY
jgi:sugar O-acyltransferase (sialic acid O-acetyltransferase NeuD family)